jgi:hypothetical protein
MKQFVIFLLSIIISATAFTAIDSVTASNIVKIIERTCNNSFDSKWTFCAIAEYPIEMKGKVKVPDLSRGNIYCCRPGVGGIVWSDNDTACILIKRWLNSKDTTYQFMWFALNKNKVKMILLK